MVVFQYVILRPFPGFHFVQSLHKPRRFFCQTRRMKESLSFPIASKPAQGTGMCGQAFRWMRTAIFPLPGSARRIAGIREKRLIYHKRKQKVVLKTLQPALPVCAMLGAKNERTIMQTTNDPSGQETLTIGKSASALGVHEFSLFSRIQAGDIIASRLRSGEMAIPVSELEWLSNRSIQSLTIPNEESAVVLPDARLGITREPFHGLRREGEYLDYTVAGDFRRFTETEINGYRAAFSAIAKEFESLGELKKQLEKSAMVMPAPETEIGTSALGVWQVRSTLLNLGQSDILLCQRQDEFVVMERFRDGSPYAKANGNAEILLQGNDARQLTAAFNANAKHTLEFMASNQVATAQKVVWKQFADHRPGRIVEAISERCRLAVANEETISEASKINESHGMKQSHGRGMRF
jgi:hypothetical protein